MERNVRNTSRASSLEVKTPATVFTLPSSGLDQFKSPHFQILTLDASAAWTVASFPSPSVNGRMQPRAQPAGM
jgi:hypothetical protein